MGGIDMHKACVVEFLDMCYELFKHKGMRFTEYIEIRNELKRKYPGMF